MTHRARKIGTLALAGCLLTAMTVLVVYAPTLYRLFCGATGFGGTVQRALDAEAADAGAAVHVRFDSNVAPDLPWAFRPEQAEVDTRIGEPTKVYYYAKNLSDKTIVARATYNVTPLKVGQYFFKIECFCFTEERLGPGESARMPLVFYVDSQMRKDPNTKEVQAVTLSYTFYRQDGLSPAEVAAARDLSAGSKTLDAELKRGAAAEFSTEVRRR